MSFLTSNPCFQESQIYLQKDFFKATKRWQPGFCDPTVHVFFQPPLIMSRLFYGLVVLIVSLAGWFSTSLCSFECWALFAGITVAWAFESLWMAWEHVLHEVKKGDATTGSVRFDKSQIRDMSSSHNEIWKRQIGTQSDYDVHSGFFPYLNLCGWLHVRDMNMATSMWVFWPSEWVKLYRDLIWFAGCHSQGLTVDVVFGQDAFVVRQLLLPGTLHGLTGARDSVDLHRLGAMWFGDL